MTHRHPAMRWVLSKRCATSYADHPVIHAMSRRLIPLDFFGFVASCNAADAEDGARFRTGAEATCPRR